ncbi:MAG: hypothetical protein J7K12_01965 [Thermoplasmata archaeon]|nr:hypothetical protein [Thermoplasmata archaeon]
MRKLFVVGVVVLVIGSMTIINEAEKTNFWNWNTGAQPTVVITQPEDGAVLTESNVVVTGYAYDESGMDQWEWTWEWTGGNYSNSSYIETTSYANFTINITGLHEGWNLITVTFTNIYGISGSDSVNVTYISDDEPPEIFIEAPEEGEIFNESAIHVVGIARDNIGITEFGYTHEWEGGSTENTWSLESLKYYPFDIEIVLHEGLNNITMLASDAAGNEQDPPVIRHVYYHPEEGLLIDAVFQPVQVVYPDDPIYGDDMSGGPCVWNAGLNMVAGKNTYIFGYPYNDRNKIEITVHNNYSVDKTFQFVMSIYPGGEEIWRSSNVTVPAKTKMTFSYSAPIPDTPFQWADWGDSPKYMDGGIILYPSCGASPPADCRCQVVTVRVKLAHTHKLNVLFLPFTFKDGPNFPPDLSTPLKMTKFDEWRLFTLEPWWNAIYPVKEWGVDTDYFANIKQNITIDGIKVNNMSQLNSLTDAQLARLQDIILSRVLAFSWIGGTSPPMGIGGWDRIVLLVHPNVLSKAGNTNGLAYLIASAGPANGQMKQGVWVNWGTKTKTAAHEISHTYGLIDCYKPPDTQSDAYGYWVNEKKDIANRKDLMWFTHPISDSWIKKPNFKSLLKRFTEKRDPQVLGISGFIDKDDNIELNPWYKLEAGYVDLEWGESGEYSIKAYDKNGALLNETGFNINFVNFMDPGGEKSVDETVFAFRLEWIDGLHRIDILNATSGKILATRTRSPNMPQISISTPKAGEKIEPSKYNITWSAYDGDDDQMTFFVLIKNESGKWFPMSLAIQNDYFMADFAQLNEGKYEVKIAATDDFNTAEATSGKFTILPDTTAPKISIERPERALYVGNRKIMAFLFTVSIGKIMIEAKATDNVGVSNVSFYIDDIMKNESFVPPYTWLWDEKIAGFHKIKVIAHDFAGNAGNDEKKILIFNS